MGSTGISAVKTAYTALNAGDPEPLAGLFGADTVWRGIEHGFLWWRRAPS
jgi:ketosteroid isomerase-like protein